MHILCLVSCGSDALWLLLLVAFGPSRPRKALPNGPKRAPGQLIKTACFITCSWALLGASWSPLGGLSAPSRGPLGRFPGSSEGFRGAQRRAQESHRTAYKNRLFYNVLLGFFGRLLEPSWGLLESSTGPLGPFPGPSEGPKGVPRRAQEAPPRGPRIFTLSRMSEGAEQDIPPACVQGTRVRLQLPTQPRRARQAKIPGRVGSTTSGHNPRPHRGHHVRQAKIPGRAWGPYPQPRWTHRLRARQAKIPNLSESINHRSASRHLCNEASAATTIGCNSHPPHARQAPTLHTTPPRTSGQNPRPHREHHVRPKSPSAPGAPRMAILLVVLAVPGQRRCASPSRLRGQHGHELPLFVLLHPSRALVAVATVVFVVVVRLVPVVVFWSSTDVAVAGVIVAVRLRQALMPRPPTSVASTRARLCAPDSSGGRPMMDFSHP